MKEYVTGHYFSNCMKKIMRYLKNPELLDKDIEKQKENNDIEILHKNKLNKNVKKVLKKAKKTKK